MKSFFTILTLSLLISCSGKTKIEKPKTELTKIVKNSIGMSFVKVNPGKFLLGCTKNDKYCAQDELPNKEITISKTIFVSVYETTIGQFNSFLKETNFKPSDKYEINKKYKDNFPVAGVSYNDTLAFIDWLNSKEKDKIYRLPTEYEWEYFCKAGTNTTYCFGDEEMLLRKYAWYWNNSEKSPHQVGTREPNNWKIFDVHGNVYEWTSSWYNSEYYKNIELIDPQGPKNGDKKVYRGGGYLCNPDYCRSSFRNYAPVENSVESVGFRLVYQLTN